MNTSGFAGGIPQRSISSLQQFAIGGVFSSV